MPSTATRAAMGLRMSTWLRLANMVPPCCWQRKLYKIAPGTLCSGRCCLVLLLSRPHQLLAQPGLREDALGVPFGMRQHHLLEHGAGHASLLRFGSEGTLVLNGPCDPMVVRHLGLSERVRNRSWYRASG